MMKFDFTKKEYDYFLEQCPFSDEEIKVFEMRRRGKSVCHMALELNVCERTIKRRIKSVYCKILRTL